MIVGLWANAEPNLNINFSPQSLKSEITCLRKKLCILVLVTCNVDVL